ncbi:MAG: twin-arginine translocase TatA/TatE family subunit [Solirubrobacteraceae bacterium]|jgi:sec-independent protein translocase protein TatA
MVGDILQPTHLLFVLVIALLVLGPKRLPEVGQKLGAGIRDFRAAINGEPERREEIANRFQSGQAGQESGPVAERAPEPARDVPAPAPARHEFVRDDETRPPALEFARERAPVTPEREFAHEGSASSQDRQPAGEPRQPAPPGDSLA